MIGSQRAGREWQVGRVEMGDKEVIQSLIGPIKELAILFCVQWESTNGLNRIYNFKVTPKIPRRVALNVGRSKAI